MRKTYKGKYKVKNIKKYKGDPTKVVYRSLWERQVFRWLESNSSIVEWNSEEIVIPYICATDRKPHRYFMDVYFKTEDGRKYLIEIKPKAQTAPPQSKKKTKRFLSEAVTYTKNISKWKAARSYAEDRGMKFEIWTEDTLKALGIKILA